MLDGVRSLSASLLIDILEGVILSTEAIERGDNGDGILGDDGLREVGAEVTRGEGGLREDVVEVTRGDGGLLGEPRFVDAKLFDVMGCVEDGMVTDFGQVLRTIDLFGIWGPRTVTGLTDRGDVGLAIDVIVLDGSDMKID